MNPFTSRPLRRLIGSLLIYPLPTWPDRPPRSTQKSAKIAHQNRPRDRSKSTPRFAKIDSKVDRNCQKKLQKRLKQVNKKRRPFDGKMMSRWWFKNCQNKMCVQKWWKARKEKNIKIIITRMQGWQLETFKESYDHKKNEGISLFKKKLLEK